MICWTVGVITEQIGEQILSAFLVVFHSDRWLCWNQGSYNIIKEKIQKQLEHYQGKESNLTMGQSVVEKGLIVETVMSLDAFRHNKEELVIELEEWGSKPLHPLITVPGTLERLLFKDWPEILESKKLIIKIVQEGKWKRWNENIPPKHRRPSSRPSQNSVEPFLKLYELLYRRKTFHTFWKDDVTTLKIRYYHGKIIYQELAENQLWIRDNRGSSSIGFII